MRRQSVRTVSLVVVTFTYLLIGAAMFDFLESRNDNYLNQTIDHVRSNLMQKYNISTSEYKFIEQVIIEQQPYKAGNQWKFTGALYFVTVVVAMIGYGHSTPDTISGKAFCIIYAGIGIPLGMVMFQSIGERLNKFSSLVIKGFKKRTGFKNTEATEVNQLLVTGTLSSVVMTAGAALFSKYEGWSYLDSFYYCFITLTTIGFGDYVALQKKDAVTKNPEYAVLSFVFILIGLTVVAASINLLVLRFMKLNSEETKAGDLEMQGANQSVVTQDGEMMAVNGKLLSSNFGTMGMPPRGCSSSIVSVTTMCSCSCSCYPRTKHFSSDRHRHPLSHRSPSRISALLMDPAAILASLDDSEKDPEFGTLWMKRASI